MFKFCSATVIFEAPNCSMCCCCFWLLKHSSYFISSNSICLINDSSINICCYLRVWRHLRIECFYNLGKRVSNLRQNIYIYSRDAVDTDMKNDFFLSVLNMISDLHTSRSCDWTTLWLTPSWWDRGLSPLTWKGEHQIKADNILTARQPLALHLQYHCKAPVHVCPETRVNKWNWQPQIYGCILKGQFVFFRLFMISLV